MLEKISDSIYVHTKGKSVGNVGVISNNTGNFLIDTSMYPVIAQELRNELEKIKTKNIKAVIFTHYHQDHVWGGSIFKDKRIYGHKLVKRNIQEAIDKKWTKEMINRLIESDPSKRHYYEGLKFQLPNKDFEEKQIQLEEDISITVTQVGGHTSGSSIIHYQTENVLFTGDDFVHNMFPYAGDLTASIYEWIDALKFIISLDPKIIVPGHGEVQYSLKEVNKLAEYLEKVKDLGEQLIKDNVEKKQCITELELVDYYAPRTPESKKASIVRMYENILEKNKG